MTHPDGQPPENAPGVPRDASPPPSGTGTPSGAADGADGTLDGLPLGPTLERVELAARGGMFPSWPKMFRLLRAAPARIARLEAEGPGAAGAGTRPVAISYAESGGEARTRRIRPFQLRHGPAGWIVEAEDCDDGGRIKDFALSGFREVFGVPAVRTTPARCGCGSLGDCGCDAKGVPGG